MEGLCRITYPDGSVYEGALKNDLPTGAARSPIPTRPATTATVAGVIEAGRREIRQWPDL